MSSKKIVAISGGFDPLHIGHIRLMKEARALGGSLVVILNNDNWLCDKKGFVFMNQDERKEILLALPFVDEVIFTSHEKGDNDRSVSRELRKVKPDIFANGGDRNDVDAKNPDSSLYKDIQACEENNIEIIFGIGHGGKVQSSSWLTDAVRTQGITSFRPWGSMNLYAHRPSFWLKKITVNPNSRLSLQKHEKRGELWMCIEGEVYAIIDSKKVTLKPFETVSFEKETPHRLGSVNGGSIIEVGFGECDEADNIRLEDDYDRVS